MTIILNNTAITEAKRIAHERLMREHQIIKEENRIAYENLLEKSKRIKAAMKRIRKGSQEVLNETMSVDEKKFLIKEKLKQRKKENLLKKKMEEER